MENKKEMRDWLNEFNLTHPFVIAGPCSAGFLCDKPGPTLNPREPSKPCNANNSTNITGFYCPLGTTF